MLARLRAAFEPLLESFWFLPLGMVLVTQAVTIPVMVADADPAAPFRWLGLSGGAAFVTDFTQGLSAAGARSLLSMIAGGMVTMISIVFSLSFVALTLTSQQLGPRIIDFWLRANSTQWLLGLSLSAFFAALAGLIAASQQGVADRSTLLAVVIACGLGSLALVAVVLFATRMSEAIRADATVERLGDAFVAAVHAGTPAPPEEAVDAETLDELTRDHGDEAPCPDAGYLGYVDLEGLAGWAAAQELRLTLTVRENDHLLPGRVLARVVGAHPDKDDIGRAVRSYMTFTGRRRRTRWADFEGDALTEMALRALSPSLNDPRTAMACVDRIAEGCGVLARRGAPSRLRRGEDGVAVLSAPGCGADWLAPRLLQPIVEAAEGKAMVLARLAQALAALHRAAHVSRDRAAVARLLDKVSRLGERLEDPDDRAEMQRAMEAARVGRAPR